MSAGFATTLAKLKSLIAPRRHSTDAEAARFGEAIRSVWQMVRALMSSAPAAVLRIIPCQSDRATRPQSMFVFDATPVYSRAARRRAERPRFALSALSPCLNDDPRPFCAISHEFGKLDYLSERNRPIVTAEISP